MSDATPDALPDQSPPVGSLVVMRGRVHAIAAGGTQLCVETSTGGFVWLMPTECEAVPERETAR